MDIGRPRRIIEIDPLSVPLPETSLVPEPLPASTPDAAPGPAEPTETAR